MERSAAENCSLEKRRRRVLVVEGDFLTRWGVAGYLRELGFDVIEAVNTQEAKASLGADTTIDAVLCDVGTTLDPNPQDFPQWIEQQYPRLPVLFTSGDTSAVALSSATASRRLIAKPYALDDIERHLTQLIEGRS